MQATLQDATLQGTNFTGANMGWMDFQGCLFEGTIFDSANLINAGFDYVKITAGPAPDNTATSFVKASLQGADFSSATITSANFTNACVAPEAGQLQVTRLGDDNTLQVVWVDFGPTQLTLNSEECSCPSGSPSPCSAAAMVAPAPPSPPPCVPSPQNWCPNPNKSDTALSPGNSAPELAAAAKRLRMPAVTS